MREELWVLVWQGAYLSEKGAIHFQSGAPLPQNDMLTSSNKWICKLNLTELHSAALSIHHGPGSVGERDLEDGSPSQESILNQSKASPSLSYHLFRRLTNILTANRTGLPRGPLVQTSQSHPSLIASVWRKGRDAMVGVSNLCGMGEAGSLTLLDLSSVFSSSFGELHCCHQL